MEKQMTDIKLREPFREVMTLVTEYVGGGVPMVRVYQRDNSRPEQSFYVAAFTYDPNLGDLQSHVRAARKWLELRESGRTLTRHVHKVDSGYWFGMV